MTPDFRVIADRHDVTDLIRANTASIRLTDKAGMEADQVEICITDTEQRMDLPRRGAVLEIFIGWEDDLTYKGSYTVDEVGEDGPPDVITIVARSADFRSSLKNSRDQSWDNVTLGDLLTEIAERNNLSAVVYPDLAQIRLDHIDQTNESDANLITRLSDDYGAVGTIKNGSLLFIPQGLGVSASGKPIPPITIYRSDGDRHSFRAVDRQGTITGIAAKWHDSRTGNTLTATAGQDGSVRTLKRVYPNQDEAQAAADAEWERVKRQAHEISLSLSLGRADLLACAPLVLDGWRPEITSLSWIAGDVTHSIDEGGFTTSWTATEMTTHTSN